MKMMIFTDGSDLKGITNAQDIKYLKFLQFILKLTPAWPGYMLGQKEDTIYSNPFKLFLNTFQIIYLILGFLFIKENFGKLSFFEMGQNYITESMTVVCVYRSMFVWTKKHRHVYKKFFNEIHLFNHRMKSEYFNKMHMRIHKVCHTYIIYVIVTMLIGELLFQVVPILNTKSSGGYRRNPPENVTYEHSIYLKLPFDYQHKFKGFIVIHIINWVECYLASNYFCVIDVYLAVMMFHLWGHLKILIYNMENFPKPAAMPNSSTDVYCEKYTPEEQIMVRQKLREIIDHHNMILEFVSEVSETFGLSIALIYAFYQVSGCVLLLECSQMDPKALMRYGPLTLILLNLMVMMSVIFDLISSLTDQLTNAAYFIPWEFMDVSCRKSVLIIVRQVQIPLGLKAVGMVEVGCKTMATILKTTLSYFVMLRTMATSE